MSQRPDLDDAPPSATSPSRSERLRALEARHHAMWNYVTYRDAIGILGLDPAALYPGRDDAPGPGGLDRPRLADLLLRAARPPRWRRCARR